jgi:hypothetical protein
MQDWGVDEEQLAGRTDIEKSNKHWRGEGNSKHPISVFIYATGPYSLYIHNYMLECSGL